MKKITTLLAAMLTGLTCASFSAQAHNTPPQINALKGTVFTASNPHIVLNKNHTTFSVVLSRKDTNDYVWKLSYMPDWMTFVSHTTEYTPYDRFNAVEIFTFQVNPGALNAVRYGTLEFNLKHANDGIVNWESKQFSVTLYPEF